MGFERIRYTPLDECRYPVGLDVYIDDLLSLLDIDSNDVRFVVICGMGGLGKTTIAKALYNRIFRSFKGSSFLKDISEEASHRKKGIISLQKQLLQDILKKESDITSVSGALIKDRLHRENILLILDNVDDAEQLDALAGGFNWFGQGSRVIITARDDYVLDVHKRNIGKDIPIYKPKELSFKNSLKLLSLHAFRENEPPEDYKQRSHEVVCYVGGLPLALEVLGSFLIGKVEEWEETLESLKNIHGDEDSGKSIKRYDDKVFGKLKISYEKLGDHVKTIFLDIACHFIGWGVEETIFLWKACELSPRLAIKELVQKHLLKIEGDNYERLRMHDLLRDMGRTIVMEFSSKDPTKRYRLWSHDEVFKVLKKDKVRPICLHLFLFTFYDN
ncbi:disease resistance protein RUN1-like [Macadamia integrifolia]|uniref:disease resistance protein RUN1-like n=1 Tax=Macadamia integrifolia TaxID=60698 RepID=UPI001C533C94|nr:disease resistance protein RUN1-like [Macadamia integrifolia]